MSGDLADLTAAQIAAQVQARKLSAQEVAQAFLDRAQSQNPNLNAFLRFDPEKTLAEAKSTQTRLDQGEQLPLAGVPVGIKDNISTKGVETNCASKILEGYVPPYNAHVIENLAKAGSIFIGKTNMDEFAMGTSTENSAFGPTRNPWDPTRAPGGSSGGSAAAVAARLTPLALGTDTGGSIRQPAALCGVVGFKPTYGRVSRYGLVAFGSSLDQIGPLATTVEDAALLASAISGHDPRDGTSLNHPPIQIQNLKQGSLKGLKVGVPKEMFSERTSPEVQEQLHQAIKTLQQNGLEITEVSIPSIRIGVPTYYIIAASEASSNLARFDGVRFGQRITSKGHVGMMEDTRAQLFGHEVKTRIMIGTYALSAGYYDAYYVKAQQVRTLMQQEFARIFAQYDLILGPTSPVIAFPLGSLKKDPMALKLLDFCTVPANMGGFPAVSLNCGFAGGLPVGLQLIGPPLADEKLLQTAYAVEQVLPNATRKPPAP
jgi:aspartyl-tRNA(Asn)/glutamyl-tRNA(Gln) amidotransferase subunit A